MSHDITELELLAEKRRQLAGVADILGGDELDVLLMVAHGVSRGRSVYGELLVERDPRDFKAEAVEELRDTMVYVGAAILRLQRQGRR